MEHVQDRSAALSQGLVIFIYLAVLTALEYGIAVTVDSVVLLILVALIKAGLVLYYYMHIYKLSQNESAGEDRHSYAYKEGTSRFGLCYPIRSSSAGCSSAASTCWDCPVPT